MRNLSDRHVRWSLWDVTQLDCGDGRGAVRPGCYMSVPLNPASWFPGGYLVLYGPPDNPQWRTDLPELFGIEYAGALGKVGLDSQARWAARRWSWTRQSTSARARSGWSRSMRLATCAADSHASRWPEVPAG
jgi:hypothetical protein